MPFAQPSQSFRGAFAEPSRQSAAFLKLANSLCALMSKRILSHGQRLLILRGLPQASSEKVALSRCFRGPSFRKKLLRAFAMQAFPFAEVFLETVCIKIIVGVSGASHVLFEQPTDPCHHASPGASVTPGGRK